MIRLALAVMLTCAALPALAQSGWNSQTLGNQTYYNGQGAMGGWTGTSQTLGNQTYSNFNGPNGQHQNCTTQRLGAQTYTNCY